MSHELPEGWSAARLDVILSNGLFCDGDWVETKDQDPKGNVRLVQLADVGDGVYRDRSARFMTSAKARDLNCTFLKKGDVLVARMPDPIGRACAFPGDPKPSVTVVDVCIVRPGEDSPCTAPYLMHVINAPQTRAMMAEHERGTTRQRISRTNLGTLELPVPPLAEQRRIVAQVEVLLGEVNAAKDRLARAPLIMKRFRQVVLEAACSGELTAEWRARQEPGEALSRVLAEAGRFVDGQNYVRRRASESRSDGSAEQVVVPESWAVVPLRRLGVVLSGQTAKGMDEHVAPRGKYPWFKVGDMNTDGNETVMERADAWLSKQSVAELGLRPLPKGAIIFPKRGGAIATNKKRVLGLESCVDLNTMAIIPHEPLASYIWWWFASIDLGSLSDGSNVPQINHPDIEELLVPVPPLAEQREVGRLVESLLSFADTIERRVRTATARVEKISQAILSKAFSGELVPTEAELARIEGRTYEPATALLDRVKNAAAAKREVSASKRGRPRREREVVDSD